MAVEHEGLRWQTRNVDRVLKIVIKKILDALINRGKVLGQKPVPLAIQRHETADQIGKLGIELQGKDRQPEITQLEISVINEALGRFGVLASANDAAQAANAFLQMRFVHGEHKEKILERGRKAGKPRGARIRG